MAELIPLALVPGLLCDAALWRAQAEALSDIADCRVVDVMTHDSTVEMAGAVLEMMPGRFAIAGFSLGGFVAFEVIRRAPQRVGLLALLGTRARLDAPEATARRRALIARAEKGDFEGVIQQLLKVCIHQERQNDAALVRELTAMMDRCGPEVFVRQQAAIMGRADGLSTLAEIACPTLVLGGRQDALSPLEHQEEMAHGIADADLVVVEECGHFAPMERPEAVTAALRDWLAKWRAAPA